MAKLIAAADHFIDKHENEFAGLFFVLFLMSVIVLGGMGNG